MKRVSDQEPARGSQTRTAMAATTGNGERQLRRWLFGFFFLTYFFFYSGHFSSIDEVHVFETTRSIVKQGNLAISPILNARQGRDGRYYSKYMVGQSILAIPFYLAGEAAAAMLPPDLAVTLASVHLRDETTTWGGTPQIFFVGLYAPFVSAILMVLFFVLQRRLEVGLRTALALTLVVGISTYVMGMSVHFLRHSSQAAGVLISLIGLLHFRRRGQFRSLIGAGIGAGLVFQFRIDGIIAVPGLVGSAAWLVLFPNGDSWRRRWRQFSGFLTPLTASLLLAIGVHCWKWGLDPLNEGTNLFAGSPLAALYGFFLSPGSSVFLYSPVLLLAAPCWKRFWKRDRWLTASMAAIGLPYVFLYVFYTDWHGLWSAPGPRYLFLPMLLASVPLSLWIESSKTPFQLALGGMLMAAGTALQIVLATVNFPYVYVPLQLPSTALDASLFIPSRSIPKLLLDHFLAGQFWDTWILNVGRGAPDVPPQPVLATALMIAWFLAWTGAGNRLLQSLRKSTV